CSQPTSATVAPVSPVRAPTPTPLRRSQSAAVSTDHTMRRLLAEFSDAATPTAAPEEDVTQTTVTKSTAADVVVVTHARSSPADVTRTGSCQIRPGNRSRPFALFATRSKKVRCLLSELGIHAAY